MRTTLITIAVTGCLNIAAQECPPMDTTAVVTVDSVPAAELYARTKRWFATAFKNGKEVIQLDDPATFTIIGKGSVEYDDRGLMKFTIEVACKEGRYRVELRDIEHVGVGGTTIGNKYIPTSTLGSIYRCTVCCENHRKWLETHPTEFEFNMKACAVHILPKARSAMVRMLASLNTGMNVRIAKDW